ncbi:MAG: RsmB/NOP family class I SAM-dependent RNA methyltransferase [Myxococcota bacterium]|nr:RsmB/NOP family class I SAM-dependent RNA methyltransferase [Myxococcota bacterium]
MENAPSNDIDWLRAALPSSIESDPFHQRPFFQEQLTLAFQHALASPLFAAPRLAQWFRKNRKLGSKDRRRVSDAVYGLIKHEQILRKANRWGPLHWAKAWIDICAGHRFPNIESTTPAEDFSVALSLPKEITEEWRHKKTPKECLSLAQNINARAPTYIRAQGVEPPELQEILRRENIQTQLEPDAPYALSLLQRANLQASAAFRNGLFEIQDLSSQLLCAAMPKEGIIVDLCAGAGGKSLALAAEGAKVYASDIRAGALANLKKRAKRASLPIQVGLPKHADIVLVDAPCSGSGRLRREPTLRWKWQKNHLKHRKDQRLLLQQAASILKNTGTIVYATCSILEAENTPKIPGWVSVREQWIWPQKGDGFYWNILKRTQ